MHESIVGGGLSQRRTGLGRSIPIPGTSAGILALARSAPRADSAVTDCENNHLLTSTARSTLAEQGIAGKNQRIGSGDNLRPRMKNCQPARTAIRAAAGNQTFAGIVPFFLRNRIRLTGEVAEARTQQEPRRS